MEDKKVDIIVHIRKNDTGEVREHKDYLYLLDDGTPNYFMWEEGNYACDCNRRLDFARANGEEEDWESGCSDNQYSIKIMVGEICIYSDYSNSFLLRAHSPERMIMKRPDCFEFGMSFMGDPEEAIIREYVERLEERIAELEAAQQSAQSDLRVVQNGSRP